MHPAEQRNCLTPTKCCLTLSLNHRRVVTWLGIITQFTKEDITMPSAYVHLRAENVGHVGQREFVVDVLTGGDGAPQVTPWGNNGYPEIRQVYAQAILVDGGIGRHKCVRLIVRFDSPIPSTAVGISFSIYQEDAREFRFPWFSLLEDKSYPGIDPATVQSKDSNS